MFGKPKIQLDPALHERAAAHAKAAGYASLDEFVAHLVERELRSGGAEPVSKEKVLEKMKGLGYLR